MALFVEVPVGGQMPVGMALGIGVPVLHDIAAVTGAGLQEDIPEPVGITWVHGKDQIVNDLHGLVDLGIQGLAGKAHGQDRLAGDAGVRLKGWCAGEAAR